MLCVPIRMLLHLQSRQKTERRTSAATQMEEETEGGEEGEGTTDWSRIKRRHVVCRWTAQLTSRMSQCLPVSCWLTQWWRSLRQAGIEWMCQSGSAAHVSIVLWKCLRTAVALGSPRRQRGVASLVSVHVVRTDPGGGERPCGESTQDFVQLSRPLVLPKEIVGRNGHWDHTLRPIGVRFSGGLKNKEAVCVCVTKQDK